MKVATAKRVLKLAWEASAKLNASVRVVLEAEAPEVFGQFRTGVGKAMGELFFSIIEPVLAEHPDLAPPGLRASSARLKKASRGGNPARLVSAKSVRSSNSPRSKAKRDSRVPFERSGRHR